MPSPRFASDTLWWYHGDEVMGGGVWVCSGDGGWGVGVTLRFRRLKQRVAGGNGDWCRAVGW